MSRLIDTVCPNWVLLAKFSTTSNVNTIVLFCYIARVVVACYLWSQFIDTDGYSMVSFVVSIRPIWIIICSARTPLLSRFALVWGHSSLLCFVMAVSEEIPLIISWPAGTVAFFNGEVIFTPSLWGPVTFAVLELWFWFCASTRLAVAAIIKKQDNSAITKACFLKLPIDSIWFT